MQGFVKGNELKVDKELPTCGSFSDHIETKYEERK